MLRRVPRVLLPAGLLLAGALILLAALPLTSASPTPKAAGAQLCEGEEVALVEGCNPVAITYEDGTPIQTIAGCVAPPEILIAIWEFEGPTATWLGYSPQFPEVSDLTHKDFLDVAFLCVNDAGTWTRPLI